MKFDAVGASVRSVRSLLMREGRFGGSDGEKSRRNEISGRPGAVRCRKNRAFYRTHSRNRGDIMGLASGGHQSDGLLTGWAIEAEFNGD
jgi:hypothetical protein